MSEEFSVDIDEKSIEELKKAINYDELEARHQRFMNGTETEDDLINGIYHYKIQNDKGLNLDVVEFKYYQKLVDLYQKEKEKNLLKEEYNEGYFQGRRDERNETDNKIKETIEDYTEKSKHPLVNAQSRREYTFGIRALQELLEERN